MNNSKAKIVGIGLSKTGTSSLAACFEHFGYNVKYFDINAVLLWSKGKFDQVFKNYFQNNNCFKGFPWSLMYKEIDQEFPGSKFILTTRIDPDVWIKSLKTHAAQRGKNGLISRNLTYGHEMPHGKEKEHIDFYNKHIEDSCEYFKNRESDFIKLCWEDGGGWEEVCSFLGFPIPNIPFPHKNKTFYK